jgi:putative MATE family efflux protein
MRDLTTGPIRNHLLGMAAPIAAGMLMQTLYYLVDLYFVGRLGDAALAGVGAAGNVMMIVIALTQVLGVGTVALIAQAVGRRDAEDANHVFNQSLSIAAVLGVLTLAGGYAFTATYLEAVAANDATVAAGRSYLYWFLPGMVLQFPMVAMISALRGTGIVKPTMIVQMATVLLNVVLAPVLIAGWGTARPLGVAGAGLASTISVAAGVVLLLVYFRRLEKYVGVDPAQWTPRLATWTRMLGLGLPAGGEFLLMFVYVAIIYWLIRDFGAAAQAGFGVGQRLMQAVMLPALALSFAVPAVAGQNVGANRPDRVRETFRSAAIMSTVLMVALTLLCQLWPVWLVQGFTDDPAVIEVAVGFLRVISFNLVASGLIFICSGMFQALGNTLPALASSAGRLLSFAVPAVWLAGWPALRIEHVWYLSVASVALQVVTSLLLLRHAIATGVSTEVPAHADAVSRDVVTELAFGEGGELVGEEPPRRGAK